MKKKNKSFGGVVAAGTALAGAALGAAAVMFSDKKNQEKIKKTVNEVSCDAVKIGKTLKQKAEDFTKKTIKSEKKTAKKIVKKSTPASKK